MRIPPFQTPRAERGPQLLGVASALVTAGYLVWRLGWTINWDAWWLSVPLVLAEVHGYTTFLLFLLMVWDVRFRLAPHPSPGLSVDFYIPTYNEPYEVLAPTVVAALGVRYPHQTWVLDDGRRPWVKELCERVGARYLARKDNVGAKAGNINAAMRVTSGEFIALVDADFVPAPNYIDDLLGYFEIDERVALVQAPQEFYNVGSFQHDAGDPTAWHEQRIFFKVIQVGKNRWNSAFWSGAPSMFRRSALESVGGISADTVTEDLHTSLRLHGRGWRTVYHPHIVALGLAPDDYDGFVLQRLRWAEGAMQVIRREWRLPGLTLVQRLNYIGSTGTYFDALRKCAMLGAVPAVLISDTLPISAPTGLFLSVWALHLGTSVVANQALGRGHYRYAWSELFDLLKMFAFLRAMPRLLSSRELAFKVTPKGSAGSRRLHPLLAPIAAVGALYVLAVAVGVVRLLGWGLHPSIPAATLAGIVWAVIVLVYLAWTLGRGYQHITRRRNPRLAAHHPVAIHLDGLRAQGETRDLSMTGCSISSPVEIPVGATVTLRFTGERLRMVGIARASVRDGDAYRVGVDFDLVRSDREAFARLFARTVFEASAGWIHVIDGGASAPALRAVEPLAA